MPQLALFEHLDRTQLKRKAGQKCPECGTQVRWFCKTLDDRLVKQANEILTWMHETKRTTFDPDLVWENDADKYHKRLDHNKLHYWGVISKCKGRSGWWEFTEKGMRFMRGQIQLPKRIWVWRNQAVEEDDEMTDVGSPDPRWQLTRADYANDYIPREAVPFV